MDNIHFRLGKPLIETSKVVTLETVLLGGMRKVDRDHDYCHPCLKIKPKERNLVHFLSEKKSINLSPLKPNMQFQMAGSRFSGLFPFCHGRCIRLVEIELTFDLSLTLTPVMWCCVLNHTSAF